MSLSKFIFSSLLVTSSVLFMACGGGVEPGGTSTSSTGETTGSGGAATSAGSTSTGMGGSGGGSSATTTTSTSGSTSGTGAGGGSPCGGVAVAPDYMACGGTTFFADGSCVDGSCAAVDPLADRTFKEWRKQTAALSGLSASLLLTRTPISTVIFENGPGSVTVRIEYVIAVDWVRSRQADTADFGAFPLATTPTDAEVTQAVKLSIRNVVWTGLGAIATVADQTQVKDALDSCSCGLQTDSCHFDFQNVTGILLGKAGKVVDQANNMCLQAKVNIGKGTLVSCMPVPCAIN
ncbi:MAG: hypothetical protein ABJE95_12015 [Byssovorax sp.]